MIGASKNAAASLTIVMPGAASPARVVPAIALCVKAVSEDGVSEVDTTPIRYFCDPLPPAKWRQSPPLVVYTPWLQPSSHIVSGFTPTVVVTLSAETFTTNWVSLDGLQAAVGTVIWSCVVLADVIDAVIPSTVTVLLDGVAPNPEPLIVTC